MRLDQLLRWAGDSSVSCSIQKLGDERPGLGGLLIERASLLLQAQQQVVMMAGVSAREDMLSILIFVCPSVDTHCIPPFSNVSKLSSLFCMLGPPTTTSRSFHGRGNSTLLPGWLSRSTGPPVQRPCHRSYEIDAGYTSVDKIVHTITAGEESGSRDVFFFLLFPLLMNVLQPTVS